MMKSSTLIRRTRSQARNPLVVAHSGLNISSTDDNVHITIAGDQYSYTLLIPHSELQRVINHLQTIAALNTARGVSNA